VSRISTYTLLTHSFIHTNCTRRQHKLCTHIYMYKLYPRTLKISTHTDCTRRMHKIYPRIYIHKLYPQKTHNLHTRIYTHRLYPQDVSIHINCNPAQYRKFKKKKLPTHLYTQFAPLYLRIHNISIHTDCTRRMHTI